MLPNSIIIFTDGSSKGNPGPGGYAAVVIFPESNDNSEFQVQSKKPARPNGHSGRFKVAELGGREEHTTNNRMELQAAIAAFSFVSTLNPKPYTLLVYSDSAYVINGITKWVFGWQKNGWITAEKNPVENKDLWEKLFSLVRGLKVSWNKVGGHVGVAGNERCDEIATEFADGLAPSLYNGDFSEYGIKNILDISCDTRLRSEATGGQVSQESNRKDSHSRAKQKAFSYVSCVDGKILIHKTWAECEARVKGKSKALYKKSISAEDEKEIIVSWQK